jgi:hypothetical protein
MTALKPLGDPNAVVCEGDVCVLPTVDDSSVEPQTDWPT